MAIFDTATTSFIATLLFTFAIIYFLLNKSKIGDKNVNVILALAIAFFSASYEPLVTGLQSVLPIAIIILIIIFALFVLRDVSNKLTGKEILPTVAALATLLGVLAVIWNDVAPLLPVSSDNALYAVGLVIILLIFYLVYKQPDLSKKQ